MTCLNVKAASFKHRVTLQSCSQTTDGQGGYTDSWSDVVTLWASIEPLKGYERYQAMQLETPVTHKVTIRYNAAVTTAKRLIYGSRVFNIKEVINLAEENAFMELRVNEMA